MNRPFQLIMLLACASAVPTSAQEKPDLELETVQASFQQQSEEAEGRQLALYADQLEKLKASLATRNETAAAEKVATEMTAVSQRLKQLMAAPPSKLPPGLPAPTSVRNEGDPSMDSIFDGESDKDKDKERQKRRLMAARANTILRYNNSVRTPEVRNARDFWATADASAKWTIENLPPGKYRLLIHYRSPKEPSGGTGQIEVGGPSAPIPFSIKPSEEDPTQMKTLTAALITIEQCPVDLTLRTIGLSSTNGPLFDFANIQLLSEDANRRPVLTPASGEGNSTPAPPTPPKKPEDTRRKVDF